MQELTNLYALDLVVLAIVLLSAVLAYLHGFVREVFSLVAWAGACLAVYYGFVPLQVHARAYVPVPLLADILTGVAIFLVTLLVLSVVTSRIARLVDGSDHGALDRALGFLFGIARGALIVCFAYLIFSWLVPREEEPDWVQTARTIPLIRAGAGEIEALIPARIERLFEGLKNPAPRTEADTDASGDETGYKDRERRELERLIQGTK